MDGRTRRWALFAVMLVLLGTGGASCPTRGGHPWAAQPAVRALPEAPSLEQVIHVVNRNNSQIHSFSTTRATLSGSGFPTLQANLAFQRPDRLRLVAKSGLSAGPELDLGSNEEIFWFWVRRSEPPAIYYCRHDRFAHSPARQMIPIEPRWMIEALGVAELDPSLPHQGPTPLHGGRFEVRTIRETDQGPMTKVTVVDGRTGWVVEQRLYDAGGRMAASASVARHRQDPLTGLVMPEVVQIQFPPAELAMQIDLGPVQINRLAGDSEWLWRMPQYAGAQPIDLGDPNLQFLPAADRGRAGVSRVPR
jgi:hypothetical protein